LVPEDCGILEIFVDELGAMKQVELQLWLTKEPSLDIYFPGRVVARGWVLGIDASGKGWIAYDKGTVVPSGKQVFEVVVPKAKADEIRDFLNESEKERSYHSHRIRASSTSELVDKMRAIIEIILRDDRSLSSPQTKSLTSL